MNTLSWIFYLIGALGALKEFAIAVVLFGAMILGFYSVIYLANDLSDEGYHKPTRYWVIWGLCLFLYIFLPDQSTMKLIAASEIGERVIKNEKVVGLVDPSLDILKKQLILFNKELERQINGETSKK